MIILGIDPGSIICGYGVIEKSSRDLKLVEYGIISAKKLHNALPQRMLEIYNRLNTVIERTQPDYSAFESMFFSKNVQSLIKLTHARSAAILSAVSHNVPIAEYSPREVKKSVTGNGNASKEQVQFMIKQILKIEETPEFYDVTDALAVAVCHSNRSEIQLTGAKSWSDYIKLNPGKIWKP